MKISKINYNPQPNTTNNQREAKNYAASPVKNAEFDSFKSLTRSPVAFEGFLWWKKSNKKEETEQVQEVENNPETPETPAQELTPTVEEPPEIHTIKPPELTEEEIETVKEDDSDKQDIIRKSQWEAGNEDIIKEDLQLNFQEYKSDKLKEMKEAGVKASQIFIPDEDEPDKTITFAEAAVLSDSPEINNLFSLAEAFQISAQKADNNTKNFFKILDLIKKQPIDDFINTLDQVPESTTHRLNLDEVTIDKIKVLNKEGFDKLKPYLEKTILTPSSKCTENDIKILNSWILCHYVDSLEYPEPYVVDFFKEKILNNENVDIFYKEGEDESVFDRIFQYSAKPTELTSEVLLKGYSKEGLKKLLSKITYSALKDKSLPAEKGLAKIIENNPDDATRTRILDFYKDYYKAGGKSDFDNVKSYEFAKFLTEAGVKTETKDIYGGRFVSALRSLTDKNGSALLLKSEFLDSIIKNEYFEEFEGVIHKEFNRPNKSLEEKEKTYFEVSKILNSDSNSRLSCIRLCKMHFNDAFEESFKDAISSDSTSMEDSIYNRIKELIVSANNEKDIQEYSTKKQLIKSYFKNIKDTEKQESLLNDIVKFGIGNFSINIRLTDKAGKMGLDEAFRKNPHLKDGIFSMGEYINFCYNNEDFYFGFPYNIELNDEKETLINYLIDIQCNDSIDKTHLKQMIKRLDDTFYIQWNHLDKYGSNYAIKAVDAENIPMINLLKENKVDFGFKNQFGQCAIELAKKSTNPEIKKMFADTKINSLELISLAKMGSTSGIKKMLEKDIYDINSKDIFGVTPWLATAAENKPDTAEYLMTRDDIDFSAKNINNNNFARLALQLKREDIIKEIFPKLTPEQLDLNHIPQDSNRTAYTITVDNYPPEMFKFILSLEGANPNIQTDTLSPIAFQLILKNDLERFKILCESGKFDIKSPIRGLSIQDAINLYLSQDERKIVFLEALKSVADGKFVNDVQKRVLENGELSLQNIQEFLGYPEIKKVINSKLSESGEYIGHMLAYVEITPQNMMTVLSTANKILNLDKQAFVRKDAFDNSPIDIAIVSGNEILFEFITQNYKFTSFEIKELTERAEQSENPNILNLTKKLRQI